jgi:putative endonuclease
VRRSGLREGPERARPPTGSRPARFSDGPTTKQTGERAEAIAAAELERRGFQIIGRNVRIGRLEIDVIGRRGTLVVFCEVRARTSDRVAAPWESIDRRKIERLRRAALGWLTQQGQRYDVRFDVASIVLGPPLKVDYFENAF